MATRRLWFQVCLVTLIVTFIGCSRDTRIIGKWRNAAQTMRFLKDGTFITTTNGSSVSGKYKFADDTHILFERNTAEGPVTSVLEYKLSGDHLTFIFPGDVKATYQRER